MARHDRQVEIHLEEPCSRRGQLVAVRTVLLHPVPENQDHVGISEALEHDRGGPETRTAEEESMLIRERVMMAPPRDDRDLRGLSERRQQLEGTGGVEQPAAGEDEWRPRAEERVENCLNRRRIRARRARRWERRRSPLRSFRHRRLVARRRIPGRDAPRWQGTPPLP